MNESRWFRFLIAVDQAANVLLWDGMPDETISARAWREQDAWLIRSLNAVFFWQGNHCKECYEWEKQRKDLPPDYQDKQ